MSINVDEKNILKELPRVEILINYNNLILKTGDPIISNYNFLKRFGKLHSLLINSVGKEKLLDKIEKLKRFILLEKKQY